ncbi:MAG: serine/threonine protein kinase, partial [Planctomycetes bacterium]|nr:serine/threonine protein kinase [Planctomycetota bacterium]
IVHRDIKPQNLLLGSDDRLHVTDFGLARILDEPGLTLSTEMVGTPAYMPPEQIQSGRRIDARADLYSLGVTFYELLTHERPFVADTYERLIDQVMRKEPRPPRRIDASIPIDLETICLRAMEKEPGGRFATAAEMARDLRRYAEDFPIASRRVGAVGRTVRWVRRNPALAGALGATLVVAVLAPLTWFLIQALANRRIEAAENLMFDDYRQPQRALDALGWAQHFGGRRDQAELLLAWIYNPDDPPRRTCNILERRLARRPDDRDARYLLTWAYVRRTQDDGPVYWAKARESLLSADQSPSEVSALGEFFHGQALVGRDPVAALTRFEAAISKRSGFTQAALHKARAYNYTIYFRRTLDYYADCQRSLEFICNDLQPNEAYPRYLLSITHYLAAEIYDQKGQAEERDEAYERALHWAQLAQQAKPSDSRGYIAEAQCRESQAWSGQTQERLASAAAAYDRLDEPTIAAVARTSDRQERERYEARVCFWLGDMEKTARVVNERYGGDPKAPITTQFDCEGRLIHAILERTRDRPLAARDWLASARTTYGEQLLLIEAAWRLTDGAPPEAFWPPGVINYQRLSDGWTEEWLSTLIDYVHGTSEWESLLAAAHRDVIWPGDERRRLAGAYFHRGVLELAAGDRAAAERSFAEAWEMRDFELYCFLAKFLLLKMRMDPAWPDWLPAR